MNQEAINRLFKDYSHSNIIAREAIPFTILLFLVHFIVLLINEPLNVVSITNSLLLIAFFFSIIYSTKYFYIFIILGLLATVIDLFMGINNYFYQFYCVLFYISVSIHFRLFSIINNWKKKHYFSYEKACQLLEYERKEKILIEIKNRQIARNEVRLSILLSIFIHHGLHFFIPGMSIIIRKILQGNFFERLKYENEKVDIYTRQEINKLKKYLIYTLITTAGFIVLTIIIVILAPKYLSGQSAITILKTFLH